MPRNALTPFPQPIFNEGSVTLDPTGFRIAHGSDTALYKQIQTLLKKEVVSFDASRAAPGDLYALQDALGPAGKDAVQHIKANGQIVFHAAGDSGASNAGKYGNEL